MITIEKDLNTTLLLRGDAIQDKGINSLPLTNIGVSLSSSQTKFSSTSLYFNGSSKITFPAINFQSGNFTIDWWEYVTSSSSASRFCSFNSNTTYGGLLLGYQGSQVYIGSQVNSWDLVSGASMFNNTLNTWVHWAIVRNGNTLTSYKNGTQFAQVAISGSIGYFSSTPSAIGDYRDGDHSYFIGYIDEFRISNVARWTSDFSVPTAPYITMSITITPGGYIDNRHAMRRVAMLTPKAAGYTRIINTNEATYTQTIHTATTTETVTSHTASITYTNTLNTAGTTYSETYYSSYGSGNSYSSNGKTSGCTQNTMRNSSRSGNSQCNCYTVYGSDNSNTYYGSYGSGYSRSTYTNTQTNSRTQYTAGTSYTQTTNTAGADYTRTTYTAGTNYTESTGGGGMPAYDTLENTSWANISIVSVAGLAQDYWSLGDTKTLSLPSTIYGSTNITFEIVGFDYDDLVGGGKAGISLLMVDCFITSQQINSTLSNIGGWELCSLRTDIINNVLPVFQSAVGGVIRPVIKRSGKGYSDQTIGETTDSLWLPSQYEIYANETNVVSGEKPEDISICYPRFSSNSDRKKYVNGTYAIWVTRSAVTPNSTNYRTVSAAGTTGGANANIAQGICIGICI